MQQRACSALVLFFSLAAGQQQWAPSKHGGAPGAAPPRYGAPNESPPPPPPQRYPPNDRQPPPPQRYPPDAPRRPPQSYGPPPGYGAPRPGYAPPQQAPAPQQQQQQQQQQQRPPQPRGQAFVAPPAPPEQMGTTEAVAPDAPPPQPKEEEEDYLSEETHAEMFEHFDKEYFFGELKKLYKRRMLPLELASRFGHFASVPMGPADFDAKPMVLLLGQYSVGKTSFIRSLLGRDFPGIRIGPEPTTDRFLAVMRADDQDRVVPGNALAMRHDKPFAGLQGFGNAFLEKLQGAEVYGCPILDNVTLVDTPGVLSGAKQRLGRDYDFPQVVRWFAERSDMIVVMFDAHKLDISDELKATVDALRPHAQKLRVVLNKADQVTPQQLLRVYGALMWQLGRVVSTPEVVRVHLGSFWDRPLDHRRGSDTALLSRERDDLLDELRNLPKNAVLRRINELSRRARKLKVHCYLIHYLRKQMPQFFGKEEKQQKLLADLPRQFAKCANRYGLTRGDFPDVDDFREALLEIDDLSKFPKLDKSKVAEMDRMFATDIPQLLEKAMAARR